MVERKTADVLTAAERRQRQLANLRKGGGRQKGVPNRVTLEMKKFSTLLLTDPVYQKNLQKRLRAGTLAPAVETMLYYYAAGKPKERIEVGADKTLADLVGEAIARRPPKEE